MRVLLVNINKNAKTLAGCNEIARALGTVGVTVEVDIAHYSDAERIATPGRFSAVILGPNGTPFPAYPAAFDRFLGWVRRRRKPLLGICGGHQALALAHGSPIGPVADVAPAATSYADMPKETGEHRIRWIGDYDPLLEGLSEECEVVASHVDEVKDLPKGFRLLAIGDRCHVQAIKADRRPVYGVQFHPEKPCSDPAGKRLLSNFLVIAADAEHTTSPG